MLTELFAGLAVLVTVTFLNSLMIDFEPNQRPTPQQLLRVVIPGICFVAVTHAYTASVPNWLLLNLRSVAPAAIGLYAGPLWGLALAIPVALYRLAEGARFGLVGAIAILGATLLGGLLRMKPEAFYAPLRHLWWRAPILFATPILLSAAIPGVREKFLNENLLILTLANSLALAAVLLVLAARLQMLRSLREARELAHTDHLTGLPNLRSFEAELEAQPSGSPGCLLLVDLDHFKAINDRHGHPVGDEALRQVADVIQAQIRTGDVVCRYGGEEFVVLLRGCSLEQGEQVAERIRQAVANHRVPLPDGGSVSLTLSGGLIALTPDTDLQHLFAKADRELYKAKELGRNRIVARTA